MREKLNGPRPLRYNITIKIAAFSRPAQVRIKKSVQAKMQVSDRTMSRWIHIRKDDSADIPGLALRHFANYLGTTVEELFIDKYEE